MFEIQSYWSWIKKNVSLRDAMILSGLIGAYLLTRLINLDAFPIFTDEGIYIHWSQVAWKDATFRFISLTDGRQPLQTWATIPFLKMFPNNMLFGGRLFAVASGLGTLMGLVTTMWYLFGKREAYFTGLLYIITPYFLFYDRLALVDSAITAAVVWMFFFSILLARTLRLDVAMILGTITGFALLGKSSVRLYAALIFLAGILIIYRNGVNKVSHFVSHIIDTIRGDSGRVMRLVNFVLLYGVVLVIAILIYNVQRLSPYLHFVELKNTTFVLTFPELMADPFNRFPTNIVNIPIYILSEMAYVVGVLGVVGFYFMYKKDRVITTYLLSWILAAAILLSFVAKVLFPRYIMPLGGLLIMPAGFLLAYVKDKRYLWGLLTIIVLSIGYFNYTILFDPARIPLPDVDRGQYIEDWPAGWGIKEIVDIAREKSKEKPVYILADGDFGMAGDVLRSHIRFGEEIHVRAHWPLAVEHLIENQDLLKDNHVLVVFSHCKEEGKHAALTLDESCFSFEETRPLKLLHKYIKPEGKASIYLFELQPTTDKTTQ